MTVSTCLAFHKACCQFQCCTRLAGIFRWSTPETGAGRSPGLSLVRSTGVQCANLERFQGGLTFQCPSGLDVLGTPIKKSPKAKGGINSGMASMASRGNCTINRTLKTPIATQTFGHINVINSAATPSSFLFSSQAPQNYQQSIFNATCSAPSAT